MGFKFKQRARIISPPPTPPRWGGERKARSRRCFAGMRRRLLSCHPGRARLRDPGSTRCLRFSGSRLFAALRPGWQEGMMFPLIRPFRAPSPQGEGDSLSSGDDKKRWCFLRLRRIQRNSPPIRGGVRGGVKNRRIIGGAARPVVDIWDSNSSIAHASSPHPRPLPAGEGSERQGDDVPLIRPFRAPSPQGRRKGEQRARLSRAFKRRRRIPRRSLLQRGGRALAMLPDPAVRWRRCAVRSRGSPPASSGP